MPLTPHIVLDPATVASLRELSSPGDNLLAEVTEIFSRDAAKWLATIREAVAHANPEGMWKAAHELRSLAANAGAFRVTHLCDMLQERGLASVLDDADELVSSTEHEVGRARDALREAVSAE